MVLQRIALANDSDAGKNSAVKSLGISVDNYNKLVYAAKIEVSVF